jgi:hypothetical protein
MHVSLQEQGGHGSKTNEGGGQEQCVQVSDRKWTGFHTITFLFGDLECEFYPQ